MTQCSGRFCAFLRSAGSIDRAVSTNSRTGMLSNEFRIISAILNNDRCVIKDLPFMTGLPNRTVFNVVAKLGQEGLIIKSREPNDQRFSRVEISFSKMKKIFCDKIHVGSESRSESGNEGFR